MKVVSDWKKKQKVIQQQKKKINLEKDEAKKLKKSQPLAKKPKQLGKFDEKPPNSSPKPVDGEVKKAKSGKKFKKLQNRKSDQQRIGLEHAGISNAIQDPAVSSTTSAAELGEIVERGDDQPGGSSEDLDLKKLILKWEKLHVPRKAPLIKCSEKWYTGNEQVLSLKSANPIKHHLAQLEGFVALLLADEVAAAQKKSRAGTNEKETNWLSTVASAGTAADRMAALILLIQESPVHQVERLKSLIAGLGKKARRELYSVAGTVKELFVETLLPDRKLIPLKMRPVDQLSEKSPEERERCLVMWGFEDALRNQYDAFLKCLEELSRDTVDATRIQAIKVCFELLCDKPEQEQALLSSIVNKLGDTSYRVASQVSHLLSKLVIRHPNMKAVVVAETERLIYRLNISQRAQYYGLCFLSGIMLAQSDAHVAIKLLDVYFGLFRLLIKKGDMDHRMLAILLAGTNRAFPFAKENVDKLLTDIDILYKVVAVAKFNTSIQAMTLIFQVLNTSAGIGDRFYASLYRKLFDEQFLTNCHSVASPLFFNLLLKSLKSDDSEPRVQAVIKRLLQLCSVQSPAFACALLMLISEVVSLRPQLLPVERGWIEPSTSLPTLTGYDSDEEERFVDAPDPDDLSTAKTSKPSEAGTSSTGNDVDVAENDVIPRDPTTSKKAAASWIHRKNIKVKSAHGYDPLHRNPLYAGAELTMMHELTVLAGHYHPTVALFAEQLTKKEKIEYEGDPLQDYLLIRFLDRFVYRNPKSTEDSSTEKRPRKSRVYNPWGVRGMNVQSDEYAAKPDDQIPVDEKYLHKFMTSISRPKEKQKKKGEDDDSDIDSVASDEFEAVLSKFEPGAKNDDFEIDFGRAFSKRSKLTKKKKKEEDEINNSDQDDSDEENEAAEDSADDTSGDEVSRKSRKRKRITAESGAAKVAEVFDKLTVPKKPRKESRWLEKQEKEVGGERWRNKKKGGRKSNMRSKKKR